jgi:hypothetical protein
MKQGHGESYEAFLSYGDLIGEPNTIKISHAVSHDKERM